MAPILEYPYTYKITQFTLATPCTTYVPGDNK
jgi:hypothetical protein